ncbi:MAG: membrane protein [Phycisphaerae bacterium]|nr:MAG: NAD(P)/FAD-dependent oxidoreductase [Planctomycetia bacterium]RIK71435.1 MAG: aminoacetone oxidase family FAD-binding enzyme [Planctomycetota bacterium]GJQ26561.1 MAG: membrane protein [Phycisphaerae bacterium]
MHDTGTSDSRDPLMPPATLADVAIIGGGAAGLATAIFAARHRPRLDVLILDGAKKLGAKILVSGGGRCNVTNARVTPEDFYAPSRPVVKKILAAFSENDASAFFRELGVALHEEQWGKLFPDSNSARTVLDALLREAGRLGVRIRTDSRVERVDRLQSGVGASEFRIGTSRGPVLAQRVVLATGGKSLPKTGSDGHGYEIAKSLGHTIVPTTPALAPLVLSGGFHKGLSGIAHEVEITARVQGEKPVRVRGPMLWTHFGVSGPAAMDVSRIWHRAALEGRPIELTANLLPADATARGTAGTFEAEEQRWIEHAVREPRTQLRNALGRRLPARLVDAVLAELSMDGRIALAHLSREVRRRLIRALHQWPLPVVDSRGFVHAEVTAGGVALNEIDPATMASRKCPGLYLVGEILDVDGRIGGFNFQWAWSTGFVAGRAMSREP